jgi:hypothetical protein
MGCCCSKGDAAKSRNGATSPSRSNNTTRPELPADFNDWTQEDCDNYTKDESLFEDELEFSKSEVVIDFHRDLNLFLSLLRQKLDEVNNNNKNNNSEKSDSPSSPQRVFHVNSKATSREEQLVDVSKIQKMFSIAVAFGRFGDARSIYKHYQENVKNREHSSSTTTKFDINAPLKPFFPYNHKIFQWSPLQWSIAIQTQRHLNEHFHEKSERLSYLKKERGDFLIHEMSREEQNKVVADFVEFLIKECGADVNCESTRREYEKLGRLAPVPAHQLVKLRAAIEAAKASHAEAQQQQKRLQLQKKLDDEEQQEKESEIQQRKSISEGLNTSFSFHSRRLDTDDTFSTRTSSIEPTSFETFSPQTHNAAKFVSGQVAEKEKEKETEKEEIPTTKTQNILETVADGAAVASSPSSSSPGFKDPRLQLQHDAQDYCHRDHPLFLATEANNDLAVAFLTSITNCVINPLNKNKDTPLSHFCDTFRAHNSVSLERAKNIARCLIQNCADVNHENIDDTKTSFVSVISALDFTVIHGHVELAEILVEKGKADWIKTYKKLNQLLQEYLKWNYGTKENALRMKKFFKELAVKNAMSDFANDISEGKISGSDVPAAVATAIGSSSRSTRGSGVGGAASAKRRLQNLNNAFNSGGSSSSSSKIKTTNEKEQNKMLASP